MLAILSLQKLPVSGSRTDLMKNSWISIKCNTAQNSTFSYSC
jgi:hypothetical protein